MRGKHFRGHILRLAWWGLMSAPAEDSRSSHTHIATRPTVLLFLYNNYFLIVEKYAQHKTYPFSYYKLSVEYIRLVV